MFRFDSKRRFNTGKTQNYRRAICKIWLVHFQFLSTFLFLEHMIDFDIAHTQHFFCDGVVDVVVAFWGLSVINIYFRLNLLINAKVQ